MPEVKIDAEAPDFVLKDFRGEEFRLSALRGQRHVVLIFNRGFT
jgi:peroxiredoxin